MKALFVSGDRFRHFADSSYQRNGQAWFIPDESLEWSAVMCPAIKITRLGTHIAEKFSDRYFDSVCAVAIFLPKDEAERPIEAPERYFVSDSSVCIGDSVAVGEQDALHSIEVGNHRLEFSINGIGAARIISELSLFCTLKMGDLIIFGNDAIISKLSEGERLVVALDGERAIELRIK